MKIYFYLCLVKTGATQLNKLLFRLNDGRIFLLVTYTDSDKFGDGLWQN